MRTRSASTPPLVAAALALASLGCPTAPKDVVYDLARRAPVAERWSSREVVLFGTPAAEPQLVAGFYREAGTGGEPFRWARGEAEVALRFDAAAPRTLVLDLAPYRGVREQGLELRLNGTPVATLKLADMRLRYQVALPAAAQRGGENRLRFVFARTASPSDLDASIQDKRELAAALYSLTVGAAADAGLDDLLRREAPRPFAVTEAGGMPTLTLVGPALVRFAIRLPEAAELRFTPELLAGARAAAGATSFRVTYESTDAPGERELWSRVLRANDPAPGEVTVPLPGPAGGLARVGLLVGGDAGGRFAWGTLGAPRILGRGRPLPLEPGPLPPAEDAKAEPLRTRLADANVLLVILDAARARQFGAYGYARATTPEVDQIAREGVVFENAYTPAVYTLGAMSSVWTSQYPDRHHGDVSFSARLPEGIPTLAEALSRRGVLTAGFVANAIAGGLNGFDRGFAEFHELWREIGSRADVFREALPPWLERSATKGRRFFAYLHYREPHFPYDPDPPFDTRFGPDGPIPKAARRDASFFQDVNQGRRPFSEAEREHLVRLYDGNLAYVDQEVGALRRAFEAAGLWEKTVVIVAADHGESLFERGWIGHNVELSEPSTRVPLVVRFPGGAGPAGARVAGLVDLLDLAPTIADVFGARGEATAAFQGRSLLPVALGAPGKPLVLSRTVWDRPRYALRDGRFTYLYETATGREQLYDTAADPGETTDRAAQEPLRAAFFRETLHDWTRSVLRGAVRSGAEGAAGMPRAECLNLKSLGYLAADHKCPER